MRNTAPRATVETIVASPKRPRPSACHRVTARRVIAGPLTGPGSDMVVIAGMVEGFLKASTPVNSRMASGTYLTVLCRGARLGAEQPAVQRVPHELGAALEPELLDEACAVCLHRLD